MKGLQTGWRYDCKVFPQDLLFVNLIPKVSTGIELNWQFHLIQRFDEKKKLLADHDTVLQTITEKLNECQQWQAQHQVKKQVVNLY